MLYDGNRDGQLAYHEILNLLIAIGRSELIERSSRDSQASQKASTDASAFNGKTTDSTGRQLRQFVVVFMQLSRQFDVNQNGTLNELELTNFADMLIQFDPGIAGQDCIASRITKPVIPRGFRQYQPSSRNNAQLQPTQTGTAAVYNLCPSASTVSRPGSTSIGLTSPGISTFTGSTQSQTAPPADYPGYIIQSPQPATPPSGR